ncbi:MAG TPA: hypothetical protein VM369_05365 [Candidatus Binatia bacterium]|nr:hypothetical protein [Candidatus Binatia bacterium]
MIKPGAAVMGLLMVAVAGGVYFGLNHLPPDMLPGALKRTHSEDIPSTTHAAATPSPAPAAATPAPAAPAANADAHAQPAPAEPATAQAPTPAQPTTPAAAPEPAQTAAAEPPTAKPQLQPTAAAAAPEPAPAPAADSAEPAAAEPAPAPAPKKRKKPASTVATAEPASSAPAGEMAGSGEAPSQPVKAAPPAADAMKPWWPDPSKMPANQLKLTYAGQVQGQKAIALMFSSPLNLDTLRQHAEVRNSIGEPVQGQWQAGNNPRLAVLSGVEPGRYTVILSPLVADTSGFMLGTELQGPVYIQ